MDPFWADPAHSCEKCGASDIGLYPENCTCKKDAEKLKSKTISQFIQELQKLAIKHGLDKEIYLEFRGGYHKPYACFSDAPINGIFIEPD